MGKVQKQIDYIMATGETPTKKELAQLGDLMLGRHVKRRRKRDKAHKVGVGSPTTKARWKTGGKRQPVKVFTEEEKEAMARAMGLNTTA